MALGLVVGLGMGVRCLLLALMGGQSRLLDFTEIVSEYTSFVYGWFDDSVCFPKFCCTFCLMWGWCGVMCIVKEALFFLDTLESSPYLKNVYHQPPLVLNFFRFFRIFSTDPQIFKLLCFSALCICDVLAAYTLAQICFVYQTDRNDQNKQYSQSLPTIVAAVYLLNPFTVFSTVAVSSEVLCRLGIVCAVYFGLRGCKSFACIASALVLHLSPHFGAVLLPCISSLLFKKLAAKSITNVNFRCFRYSCCFCCFCCFCCCNTVFV